MNGGQAEQWGIERRGQRAGKRNNRQSVKKGPIQAQRSDLLFGEQFDRVGQRLEPARSNAVLETSHQLSVGPFVEHPAENKSDAGGENHDRQ